MQECLNNIRLLSSCTFVRFLGYYEGSLVNKITIGGETMSSALLHLVVGFISIIAGTCFLLISIFLRQWFVKEGLLRKKYSGDDGRIFYGMIGAFFLLGGIAFLIVK
jgi:hypothetical protein